MYVIFRKLAGIPEEVEKALIKASSHRLVGVIESVNENYTDIYEAIIVYRMSHEKYSNLEEHVLRYVYRNCATYSSFKRLHLEMPIINLGKTRL